MLEEIDEEILNQLQSMNIDKRQARKAISSNQHNTITTTYYLLLKQKLMRGGTIVVADSNSLEDRSSSPSNPTVSTVASVLILRTLHLPSILQ